MTDIFREARERVSAEEAARFYGVMIDRSGKALCPFHGDTHPSMTFKYGRFHCWACDAKGTSIDLVARMFGLDALQAVKKLNNDFGLRLPLNGKPDTAELEKARIQRENRRKFEMWREQFGYALDKCIRTANTISDYEHMTEGQAIALKNKEQLEYYAAQLAHGSEAEQLAVFKNQRRLGDVCRTILTAH